MKKMIKVLKFICIYPLALLLVALTTLLVFVGMVLCSIKPVWEAIDYGSETTFTDTTEAYCERAIREAQFKEEAGEKPIFH